MSVEPAHQPTQVKDPQEVWTSVDIYFTERLHRDGSFYEEILARSDSAGLPEIHVSASQGKLLQLLAKIHQAKTILEIGTLAGYSTVWMANALPPDGRIVTLEFDPKHAELAQQNFQSAGLADSVELRQGAALETLPEVERSDIAPFDMTFIDADKVNIPAYFDWAVKLSRPGSIVIVDNVVREGAILRADSNDPSVGGVRRLADQLAKDDRVDATVVQTVGAKGYDGFVLAIVK